MPPVLNPDNQKRLQTFLNDPRGSKSPSLRNTDFQLSVCLSVCQSIATTCPVLGPYHTYPPQSTFSVNAVMYEDSWVSATTSLCLSFSSAHWENRIQSRGLSQRPGKSTPANQNPDACPRHRYEHGHCPQEACIQRAHSAWPKVLQSWGSQGPVSLQSSFSRRKEGRPAKEGRVISPIQVAPLPSSRGAHSLASP